MAKKKTWWIASIIVFLTMTCFAEHTLCPINDSYTSRELPTKWIQGKPVTITLNITNSRDFIDIYEFLPSGWSISSWKCDKEPKTVQVYPDGIRIVFLTYPNYLGNASCEYVAFYNGSAKVNGDSALYRFHGYESNNHIDCKIGGNEFIDLKKPRSLIDVVDSILKWINNQITLEQVMEEIKLWTISY
jgi:hypothetical protein